MSRVKVVLTAVQEYDVDPTNYPAGMDLAGMIETDRTNAEEDPELFLSGSGVVITAVAEVVS